jgi:hypothetical protein
MRARTLVVLLSASLLGGLGCKGDRVKCEKAARNYATLVYWQRAEAEMAKLPTKEERDAERKKRLSKFTLELEKDIDFFVTQCVSANNDDMVDCMIDAKTGDEASKCADLITPD